MTRRIADIAIYQKGLTLPMIRAAGFDTINLKTSHGMGRKNVHPDTRLWAAGAFAAHMGISTFHWLDNTASGMDQARFAYARLTELGIGGVAHVVDCEADASFTIYDEYVRTMSLLLARPIATYTGDWWWKPRKWTGAELSPWLWAAPNNGYVVAYPGDNSILWRAGYGGWADLSVMQYAVRPINGINVSMSAMRDEVLWLHMTGTYVEPRAGR